MSVLLETSLGDIVIDLETDACPKTCQNFLKLCKVYYYNLNAFFNGIRFMPITLTLTYTILLFAVQFQKIFLPKLVIHQLRGKEASPSGL